MTPCVVDECDAEGVLKFTTSQPHSMLRGVVEHTAWRICIEHFDMITQMSEKQTEINLGLRPSDN